MQYTNNLKYILATLVVLACAITVYPVLAKKDKPKNDELAERMIALEALVEEQTAAIVALTEKLACVHSDSDATNFMFHGCNVHIQNGDSTSSSANTLGNLVIGYNEDPGSTKSRIGSHNLVIGPEHEYNGTSGIIAGTSTARIEVEDDSVNVVARGSVNVVASIGDVGIGSVQGKVAITGAQEIGLKVGGSQIAAKPATIKIESTQLDIESTANLDIKGSITSVRGLGLLRLDGGVVRLAGGGTPVAGVGDLVQVTIPFPGGDVLATGVILPPGGLTVLVP